MAYCKKCGQEIDDEAVICPHCGVLQKDEPPAVEDSGSFGWAVLGFLIPIVGLILFLVWRNEKPKSAKKAGIGALVSVILGVVISIIIVAVGAAGMATMATM